MENHNKKTDVKQKIFISYVREHNREVAKIAKILEKFNIEVWLDINKIKPGSRWQDSIRKGISEGDFFLACFSPEYNNRSKTYMNEELLLAIDELRQMPDERTWFIPVKLAPCEIPDRNIGAGETLRSIQWVELYKNWREGILSIISVISPNSARIHKLIEELNDPSARIRIAAADSLGQIGNIGYKAVPSLVMALNTDKNDTVRAVVAEALGKLGYSNEIIISELLETMRKGEYYSSRHAAHSLSKFGGPAIPALLEATQLPGYWIGGHAAEAIGNIRDPNAVNALIEALKQGHKMTVGRIWIGEENTAIFVSVFIAKALGKIGGSASITALEEMLIVDNWRTRLSAVEALGNIKSSSVISMLRKAAKDNDEIVRIKATEILQEMVDQNH